MKLKEDPRNDEDYDTFDYGTEPIPGDMTWAHKPKAQLSPAAQAVYDAYFKWADNPHYYECSGLVAALRAVADQVVPSNDLYARSCCEFVGEQCRADILAIADELEDQ